MTKFFKNFIPSCFLLEAAAIIFIAITFPFWFPIIGILTVISAVLALLGIGGFLIFH